jgi:hypothetical protein
MSTEKADIDAYLQSLFARLGTLTPVSLTLKQRRAMGGRLFTEAPYLIRRLAAGLLEAPHLFTQAPVSGQELLDHQDRACAWRDLRNHLHWLAGLANDGYLSEQSAAIEKMGLLIEHMEREAQAAADEPLARERRFALAAFFLLLSRRQERIRKKIRRVRRKRAQENAGG